MDDDLYARFDRFRSDSSARPAADPVALRAAAERGSRVRAWSSAAAVAVAVLAVGAAVAVAGPPPVTPAPNASATAGPTGRPTESPAGPSRTPELTPSPAGPSVTPSTPSSPQTCPAADLTVATYGGDGFSGGSVIGVGLTNTGGVTCLLYGAFDVLFVDAKGRRLATNVVFADGGRSVLTLRPGAIGYFSVTRGDGPAAGETGAPCDPPASGLRITPRGNGGSLTLKGIWRACGHGLVTIGPLLARPDPNWHS